MFKHHLNLPGNTQRLALFIYMYIYIYIYKYIYMYIYYVHVRNNPIFVSGDTQPSSAILFPKNTACQVTQGAAFVLVS